MPAESVWRTWKVCEALVRPVYVFGLVQAVKAPPSIAHWKVALTSPVKEKEAEVEFVRAGGVDVIEGAAGAVVSIVHV